MSNDFTPKMEEKTLLYPREGNLAGNRFLVPPSLPLEIKGSVPKTKLVEFSPMGGEVSNR